MSNEEVHIYGTDLKTDLTVLVKCKCGAYLSGHYEATLNTHTKTEPVSILINGTMNFFVEPHACK